jgi:hypothetical protein
VKVDVEHGDLDKAIVTFDRALKNALPEVAKVVGKGSNNIKKDARRRARKAAGRHARRYPYTIGYDLREYPYIKRVESEIGPDKNRKQGALGNLLEYGSVNNAPQPHMRPATDAETPKFESAMEALAVKLLEGR